MAPALSRYPSKACARQIELPCKTRATLHGKEGIYATLVCKALCNKYLTGHPNGHLNWHFWAAAQLLRPTAGTELSDPHRTELVNEQLICRKSLLLPCGVISLLVDRLTDGVTIPTTSHTTVGLKS